MTETFSGDKAEDQKTFTRRAFIVGGLQMGILCFMGGRLALLQIAEGHKYRTLSDNNRIHTKILSPSRGEIVDRYGAPLALNKQNFRVLVTPEQTENLEKTLGRLSKIITLEPREIERTLREAAKIRKFSSVEIKDDLNWEDVSAIEVNLPDLPGLRIDVGERRNYPLGQATAHLIGYVGAVNDEEVNGDPLLSQPGFKIGKSGVEKSYDALLRGEAGSAQIEVNVVGREVRELGEQPCRDGQRLVLSIDGEMQSFAQARLEEERSAAAVIMDAHTGAIYTLASGPSFDPNIFTKPLPADIWEQMISDPGHPLTNKAVAGQYPPGSTFKMVTALAALEAGVADINTRVFCPGHYDFGVDKFHCWKKGGHGTVNVISALEQSCDVFFYKLSTDIGIDRIAAMARRLGLGELHDFGLPEERPGLIPDKQWKQGYFGKGWQPGETIVASIGQGYTLTTPIQLAVMGARLVNGGNFVYPWLYREGIDPAFRRKIGESLGLNAEHLAIVGQGMNNVVNSQRGTAYGARIREAGMEMGGKTGTAQVKRISMQQRLAGIKNESLPWKYRHHALFVGYAPVEAPRYVCSVIVEHGVSGSGAAAPLARDLLLEVQKRSPAGKGIFAEKSGDMPGKKMQE